MPDADEKRRKSSLQKRVVELLQRDLPAGWTCRAEEEHVILSRVTGNGSIEERQLSLEGLYESVEKQPDERRELLHSFVHRILATVRGMGESIDLARGEHAVYPVLRHRTFVEQSRKNYVNRPHTAETYILYAYDLPEGYVLIEQHMLEQAGWDGEKLHACALDNLRQLPFSVKEQQVGEQTIYFISPTDGYAASRVLFTELLAQYERNKRGDTLGIAVPHQDVLILADLVGERGAQLLARLTYHFAARGDVPICPLPFVYQDGSLETIIVIQK